VVSNGDFKDVWDDLKNLHQDTQIRRDGIERTAWYNSDALLFCLGMILFQNVFNKRRLSRRIHVICSPFHTCLHKRFTVFRKGTDSRDDYFSLGDDSVERGRVSRVGDENREGGEVGLDGVDLITDFFEFLFVAAGDGDFDVLFIIGAQNELE
jgi:hypothetical protein